MNAYKRYIARILEVKGGDEYSDLFNERFDQFYKGEGDHEGGAAEEAFLEIATTMEMDGVIDDSTKI